MIFDCFLFAGERDLLKIRCEELHLLSGAGIQVKHVAVESKYTFTGKERKFSMTMADIQNYGIDWVPLNDVPYSDPWMNEQRQRNAIKSALVNLGAKDDDIVIISDVDEIPRTYAIQHYRPSFGLCALQMDVYHYYLNTRAEYQSWRMPRIMTWGYLKDKTVEEVRRSGFNIALVNGGWHFTYMAPIENILKKFESFSHQEERVQKFANRYVLQDKMDRLEMLWEFRKMEVVPEADLPYYVQMHKEDFTKLLRL